MVVHCTACAPVIGNPSLSLVPHDFIEVQARHRAPGDRVLGYLRLFRCTICCRQWRYDGDVERWSPSPRTSAN